MSDIQTRPFSKNYSGLINQSVIAITISVVCVTAHELMKRKRRGQQQGNELGSRESWEFGYLFQGRSWARYPSPPSPLGWPLSWVKPIIYFPEDELNELRGVDATLYIRFLRGCFWFALLHTFTTFPILFPIHIHFSKDTISQKSMTRASISSLVSTLKGLSLLWIHILLLFWITISWIITLCWVCSGAFRLRQHHIDAASNRLTMRRLANEEPMIFQHPHPPYTFADIPTPDQDYPNLGLRSRTIMVSNVPLPLRNEKELKEYFMYYMGRKLEKPSVGLTSSTQPGFFNKFFIFLFNRVKRLPTQLPARVSAQSNGTSIAEGLPEGGKGAIGDIDPERVPVIERVAIARKMTELASLLERREEILANLETAHIKLAIKALHAVKVAMDRKSAHKPMAHSSSRATEVAKQRKSIANDSGDCSEDEHTDDHEDRMNHLVEVLGPYVEEFGLKRPLAFRSRKALVKSSRNLFRLFHSQTDGPENVHMSSEHDDNKDPLSYPLGPSRKKVGHPTKTVWDALLSLPRSSLDAYQPLVNLSHLFRGKTVPAIDYYTTKLNFLTALITENRAKAVTDYDSVSTAFVTFADPAEARRACKYLAVHPNNPLACLVTMAPVYEDLDWMRVMKTSFNTEFVKDWVVNIGVWAFTLFWLFPVSLLVGLVSIQNISQFWPSLKRYLDHHAWQEEVIQSFLPTLLVAVLALLIPLILFLIAKKAHTITTLSHLHDKIMTRYYKFLIVNVLVFFCVGTAALQSFLLSFKSTSHPDVLHVVADSFPTAGPFYVGWLIFTTAIHGCFELALIKLPLIMYPSTSRQITPRKRTVGIRPRTFNYYYWLPNHLLVLHVLLLFSILNPFVLPFGVLYYFVQIGIIKNQFIHVYAKNYEGNGQTILIRVVRYSLDGLVLSQAVFLAYMVVLKKSANVGLSAFLIVATVITKIIMTRICRSQFEKQDIEEAQIRSGCHPSTVPEGDTDTDPESVANNSNDIEHNGLIKGSHPRSTILTRRLPAWVGLSYGSFQRRPHRQNSRKPIPFSLSADVDFTQLRTVSPGAESSVAFPLNDLQPVITGASASQNGASSRPNSTHRSHMAGPVVPHPPPGAWDDQTMPDRPYDNPFYIRPIDNVLWLPKNPCGVLDLDDTVDLRMSLTVEISAGKLGPWLGTECIPERSTPTNFSKESEATSLPQTRQAEEPPSPPIRLDGTEEILLPEVITRRVMSREVGIEQAPPPRPSAFRRRTSNRTSASSPGQRHLSLFESPPKLYIRSFSEGNEIPHRHSLLGTPTLQAPPQIYRSHTSYTGEDQRTDTHIQASMAVANASAVGLPASRAPNVSTHEAIYNEVLAEEVHELNSRLEEEKAEEDKAKAGKSWFTSWMFKSAE
ncbi:hypothetical protein AMATHDRAFT_38479 [Amanita thiersii Skay4041]|uniref:CSC1/OSCA1-like 7TM region domain-containing protein n=1 Tax=Amanita thiersii Skay4041 TaxID=703135 RepID=A0A2A9NSX9_9AGAR|nr:hypothetical protein AMATHDRAFT_38479 [Amanita thiersii Skay4041]